MYRSVFIFQKRGNLSCCECLCVFLYMCESGKWKVIRPSLPPFQISEFCFYDSKLFFLPLFFQSASSYVVKWLRPSTISLVSETKRQTKKKWGKKKKSFSILKEKLKALKYTEHLPLPRPVSVGAGRHCTA